MREFKVIKIEQDYYRFLVEIEFLDDASRKKYGYPLGNGWDKLVNGEYRFLHHIAKQVQKEFDIDNSVSEVPALKLSVEGKKFSKEMFKTKKDVS